MDECMFQPSDRSTNADSFSGCITYCIYYMFNVTEEHIKIALILTCTSKENSCFIDVVVRVYFTSPVDVSATGQSSLHAVLDS
jgi:hypothetical protein